MDDTDFDEVTIDRVERHRDGGYTIFHDSVGFGGVPADTPIVPKPGMLARFYGGFRPGCAVRGLSLDGVMVFYRTKSDDADHREIERYGADAAEWLSRWDAGRSVWSIEMGGLGPGYEQCIQITAAEMLRIMLREKYDPELWADKDVWKRDRDAIDGAVMKVASVSALGLSAAQYGAALSLAATLYKQGPRKVMNDPQVKDRHIQVSAKFP